MDVSFANGEAVPARSRRGSRHPPVNADGKPAPLPAGPLVPANDTFTGAAVPLGEAARMIEPPLRGGDWVSANGCLRHASPRIAAR